ncbi:DUF2059 domain-containing protein [Bradyrhizobium uaiense]|uniref:DUF2059 domain-containing protein n=1 Tax=Bradyrhizobium uaiense TaxID=2594946 RepID=A0A6P1BIT3_9BRAD|nr:DUF2059 domain-containing protein [Bradyrhizobium uaiense]NEU97442.1 DUF2059 domain-containing protein [Bradyrhizobium uaiense]
MKLIAKLLTVAPIVFLAVTPALALDDTPANRGEQADNYLRAVPPQSLMKEMAVKVAATVPESQRSAFVAVMTQNLDLKAVEDLMRGSMIKNFTADELKALADFYASPIGKSAMAKMGNYLADAMPKMMVELQKALALTQQQMKAQ